MLWRLSLLALLNAIVQFGAGRTAIAADPDPALVKQVQTDVKLLRESVYKPPDDVDAVLKITHPVTIEEVGGEAKARENATSAARKQVSKLFTVEKVEFPESPKFFAGKEHEFVFVPIKMTLLRADGIRDVSTTFYLGGRKPGDAGFVYADGAKLTLEGNVATFFADYPKDVEFPKVFRQQVRPNR